MGSLRSALLVVAAAALFAGAAGFGGMYVTSEGGCTFANPWTRFECSCPGRTSKPLLYSFNGPSQFYYCMDAAPDPSFGGAFQLAADGSCLVANEYIGACACPHTGAYRVLPVAAQQNPQEGVYINTTLSFCVGKESLTFGGMYVTVEWTTCVTPNPMSGACTCPNGNAYPWMADTMVDDMMRTGNFWACYAPCHFA
jgi:hypothetical protein